MGRIPLSSVLLAATAVSVFLLTSWLTHAFSKPGSRLWILDHPNERSLHSVPTPRTGGIAILIGIFLGSGVIGMNESGEEQVTYAVLGVLTLAIAVVSYIDDRRHVAAIYRLTAHLIGAWLLLGTVSSGWPVLYPGFATDLPGWLASLFLALLVVWMTNLYNFMDGMDGFAGGMAVFGFGTLALLGWRAGNDLFCALNLLIMAAASGFLWHNFPPAKIFMGDTGSTTLGFTAAGMMVLAEREGVAPLWLSLVIFLPFISDATVTLLRRLLQGERVWEAHRSHYYQRLVQLGWGHRKTVLAEYGLMALCGGAALLAVDATEWFQWVILIAVVLIFIGFFGWVRLLEVQKTQRVG